MSTERVEQYLAQYHMQDRLQKFEVSSATVELASQALGVEPARIAKSISLHKGDGCVILVAAGDAKVDNAKFKAEFGEKARMLKPEEVEPMTGYQIGGVSPFDNPSCAEVYCDVSLQRFDAVYPAGGTSNSCVRLNCEELATLSQSKKWVDVCKNWGETEE
jgi:prolyl-tRNA editing enzyme YbaK/EbsC (Cys-tRNA(Pro) deacylase)